MASHPWLNFDDAPCCRVNFPDDPPPEEVAALADAWLTMATQWNRPYGVVCDLTGLLRASSAARHACAQMDRRMASLDKKFCAGTAFVLKNRIVRGLITAVYWLAPPVYTYRIFETHAEAEVWVRRQLSESRAPEQSALQTG